MRIEIFTKSHELPQLIDGPIQHSALMFRSIEGSSVGKPYMLVAYDDTGKEQAHMLMIKKRDIKLIPPVLSVWYSIQGEGAYSKECRDIRERETIFAFFLEKIFDIFDFRHTFIEIQNINDARFAYGTLSKHSFVPVRDRRIYISLHSKAPQERLTRPYRSHIRKAEERGVTTRCATNDKEIDEALTLLRNFYRSKTRKRLPDTKSLFKLLHNSDGSLSKSAKMFLVIYKERIIGSSICLYEEGRAYLAYSCGLRKRFPLQFPGIMAIWAALSDAYNQGYEHFEFLEVRGLSKLRRSYLGTIGNFGGKEVSTLRWYHFKWNWINNILRWIYV